MFHLQADSMTQSLEHILFLWVDSMFLTNQSCGEKGQLTSQAETVDSSTWSHSLILFVITAQILNPLWHKWWEKNSSSLSELESIMIQDSNIYSGNIRSKQCLFWLPWRKHLAECQVGNQYHVAHKRLCRPQVPMMKTPGCQKQGLQSLVRLSLRTHIYESHRENWSSDLAHINDSLWTFVHE